MQEFKHYNHPSTSPIHDISTNVHQPILRSWDIEKNHLFWSEDWQLSAEDQDANTVINWHNNIHEEDLERVKKTFNEAFHNKEKEVKITYRFRQNDNRFREVHDTALIVYRDSTPVFLSGIMTLAPSVGSKPERFPDPVTSIALEASGSGSFTLIMDTDEVICSPNFARILTGSSDLPADKQIFVNHIHQDDLRFRNEAYKIAEKSGVLSYEARFIWQDSSVHWIKVLAKYVYDVWGKAESIAGIVMDISQQIEMNQALKLAEQAAEKNLHESEALFRNITAASTAALWITDEKGQITYVSQAWIEWTGAPLERHLGGGWLDFVAAEDLDMVRGSFYDDFNKRTFHQKQFRIIHLDTRMRHVVCKGSAQYNERKEFTGYIGAVTDISELVEAQQQLEISEALMHAMIEQSPVGIGLFEGEQIIVKKANPAILRIVSKDESIVGMTLPDAIPEMIRPGLTERFREVYHSGEVYETYDTEVIFNGTERDESRYLNIACTPIKTNGNITTGIMVVVSDFTWQHQAQLEMKAGEQRFRSLIEESPVACALFTGRDMVIEYANDVMIKILGKGPSILSKKLADALPELDGQPFLEILDQVYLTGVAYHSTNAASDLVVDGIRATYYFDFSYTPLFDANQNVYGILEMAVDVTERVRAVSSLQQSEQRYRELADNLERSVQARTQELNLANRELQNSNQSLEHFAYAASHDLQEPLRKVVSFGSRLAASYQDQLGDDGKFLLSRMQDASLRMSKMIEDLLSFSRLKADQKAFTHVDLNQVLRSVLSDLEISVQEKNAVIEIDLPTGVWGDATQLAQLFLNLFSNALKYQPQGHIPHIKVTSSLIDPAEISKEVALLPGHPYVKITVEDNGIGFDQKYEHRIFQMFQRLHGKNEYSGTGIGLALCKKVAHNHYGLITAKGEVDKGACFMLFLPVPVV